jgi:putative pyoverdin transport system ATP-binding/permease protein
LKLLLFFVRYSPRLIALSVALGALGGGSTALLMAVVNQKLGGARSSLSTSVWVFVGLLLAIFLSNLGSRLVVIHLSQRVMYELRMDLCRQVAAAPLRSIEELGSGRIFALLSEDINAVTTMMINMPSIFVNCAIIVSCLVYLATLSPLWMIGFVAFIGFGVVSTRWPENQAILLMRRARENWDAMSTHFRALTDGLKELKLHLRRREAFFSGSLESAAMRYRSNRVAGARIYAVTNSWSQVLLFCFIGLLLFATPLTAGLEPGVLIGYILTILFVRGPIVFLVEMTPAMAQAQVSLRRVEELGLSLTSFSGETAAAPGGTVPCERIDLVALVHTYYREKEDRSFLLGPIDLTIFGGDLVFLVGGNGSGKTTLIKLLTALYLPESGELRYNGQTIAEDNREWYRQHFAVVFYDFFLFDRLLGLESAGSDLDGKALKYLEWLQLDHKVSVENGLLSTTNLSQGQRKRLALLTAYLENRPIYIFDEWAADQDPLFKDVFYHEILPELRARGKTVIVVSHDDRYFHLADRIVKLESGKLIQDFAPAPRISPVSRFEAPASREEAR